MKYKNMDIDKEKVIEDITKKLAECSPEKFVQMMLIFGFYYHFNELRRISVKHIKKVQTLTKILISNTFNP